MQAIIFDLDGTLLNTLDDLAASVNHALHAHHMPGRTPTEVRRFLGNGIRRLIEQSVPQGTSSEATDSVLHTFHDYYIRHSLDQTRPYDGVVDMVNRCKQMGLKTAIVSNKVDDAVQDLYHRFFAQCIDVAIGEREGVRRKPAPDMVQMAMEYMGVKEEGCIYVGDSEVDIQTARNAGLPCISVAWGFRDRDHLIAYGANNIIDNPIELIKLL